MNSSAHMPRQRTGCRLVLLLVLAALGGCRAGDEPAGARALRVIGTPETASPKGRLVVLGVDGLPPELLERAVAQGLVPTFARFVESGVSGTIDVSPAGLPPLSPRIWTSFATGQLPKVHGLKGFVRRDQGDQVLYDSTMRRSPAIWNIASALEKSVGVVNWWATSPAEAVDGFMISDWIHDVAKSRLANKLEARSGFDSAKVVFPGAVLDELRSIRAIERKVGSSPMRAEELDASVMEMAKVAFARWPVEVFLVYTRGFDELAHMAWHTHDRRSGEPDVGDRIVDYLRRYDWLLERFVRFLGPEDHFVVLSDHGFERMEDGSTGGTHKTKVTASATLLMHGPRLRRGIRIPTIDLLDVLPTLLELAGLPAALDMPGTVASAAFLPHERRFLPRVESYRLEGGEEVVPSSGGSSASDDAIKERLRALGYLDDH